MRLHLTQVLSHPFFNTRHSVMPLTPINVDNVFIGKQKDKENTPTSNSLKAIFSVPNFTTLRLKPLKQTLKYGKIEILENGNVLVDFTSDKHLMVLNHNASKLKLFKRGKALDGKPDYSCEIGDCPKNVQKTILYVSKLLSA